MIRVSSEDLRERTDEVLRQVAHGSSMTITVDGAPVADITPRRDRGRQASLSRGELTEIIRRHQADAGLHAVLGDRTGDDTDELVG